MKKIMLVEDDKSLREIYGIRLIAEGYEIKSAGDGEEALAMAIKERPDLILSDVMMPKISGFDMLDILRSTPETKDIKVIMMTALSSEDQRTRGESLGANRYLVKSQVGIEDVIRTVHDVLADVPVSKTPVMNQPFGKSTPLPSAANAIKPALTTSKPVESPAQPKAEVAPETKPETETPVSEPIAAKPDDISEPSESNPEPEIEVKPDLKLEPKSEPIVAAEPKAETPVSEPVESKLDVTPESSEPKLEPKTEIKPDLASEPKSEPIVAAEPEVKVESEPLTTPAYTPEVEPKPATDESPKITPVPITAPVYTTTDDNKLEPASASIESTEMPQPTAPFSSPAPASLGDSMVHPTQPIVITPPTPDIATLMDQELNNAAPTPPPTPQNPSQSNPPKI